MKPIQVGLLGIGTVGSGTFKVLQRNQEEIRRRAGRDIQITMVADLDVARAKAVVGERVKEAVLNGPVTTANMTAEEAQAHVSAVARAQAEITCSLDDPEGCEMCSG